MATQAAFRPILPLPRSGAEIVVESLAALGVLSAWLIVAVSWSALPEIVPHHFDGSGRPDAWGSKYLLWIFPALALFFYVGFTLLARIPHRFNYWVPLTEQNAERQFRNARCLLAVLKAEVTAFMAFLGWDIIRLVKGNGEKLSGYLIPVAILVILGTVAVFMVRSLRAR
jgi:uncharacterized membrane protein